MNTAYEISDLNMAIKNYNTKWINKIREEWIPEIVSNTMNEVRYVYYKNSIR
jgi:hypothetical protein